MRGRIRRQPEKYLLADAAVRTIFVSMLALLCFFSAIRMVQDVFPDWVLSKVATQWVLALLIFTVALYEMGGLAMPPAMRFLFGIAVPIVYGVVCYRYAKPRQIDLEDGACALATQFLLKFNRHLKTSFWIWEGKEGLMGFAFAFWALVTMLGLLALALLMQKRVLLLLLPAAVFAVELLIGYVPQWDGMAFFFVALLFVQADGESGEKIAHHACASGWTVGKAMPRARAGGRPEEKTTLYACAGGRLEEKTTLYACAGGRPEENTMLYACAGGRPEGKWYLRWLSVGCLAGASMAMLLLGSVLSDATSAFLLESSPKVQAFQKDAEQGLSDIWRGYFRQQRETVGNQTPQYAGKEMLQITASKCPAEDVLLKGFCGTDYKDGSWTCETQAFADACADAGYGQEEAARELSQSPYDLFSQGLGRIEVSYAFGANFAHAYRFDNEKISYTIKNTGIRSKYAFLPYAADYGENQGNGNLVADTAIQKARGQHVFSCSGWSCFQEGVEVGQIPESQKKQVFQWYDKFARDAYLKTSGRVPSVNTYLEEMARLEGQREEWLSSFDASSQEYGSRLTWDSVNARNWIALLFLQQKIAMDSDDASSCNLNRIEAAIALSATLKKYQNYSMDLDPLPAGEDPVYYFLMHSQKGYCMHFASAAVLMLRELGVPARYASGYVARAQDFRQVGGSYVASVRDSDAHAWVEIYLEQIGWVPMDVTPAASRTGNHASSSSNTGVGDADSGIQAEPDDTQADSRDVRTQTGLDDTETGLGDTHAQQNKDDVETPKDSGRRKPLWQQRKLAFGMAGLLLPALFACLAFLCSMYAWHTMADREIKAGKYNKAVRRINQRIYRRLCRRRKASRQIMTDSQYGQGLIAAYPKISAESWTRYMQIAQAAAFAQDEVPEEDAKYCCQIYRYCSRLRRSQ